MDYQILRSRLSMDHEGSSIRLAEIAHGTEVTWTSTFRIRAPLLRGVLSSASAVVGKRALAGMLKAVDKRLQGH